MVIYCIVKAQLIGCIDCSLRPSFCKGKYEISHLFRGSYKVVVGSISKEIYYASVY